MTTAALTIDANACVGISGIVRGVIRLTDLNGATVAGHISATGATVVLPGFFTTDINGLATAALEPNANITPVNTYYTVTMADQDFLILKTSATQTILQALVSSPSPLGQASSAVIVAAQLHAFAADPWGFTVALTTDTFGTILTGTVTWPDGTSGTLTTTVVSIPFPGFSDAWTITYGTTTYTTTVTRNTFGQPTAINVTP